MGADKVKGAATGLQTVPAEQREADAGLPRIVGPDGSRVRLVPVAHVSVVRDAHELRRTLAGEDIESYFPDEESVMQTPTQPGHIVLYVAARDAEAALALLRRPRSALTMKPSCPACGSDEVYPPRKSWLMFAGFLLSLSFASAWGRLRGTWRCYECEHQWKELPAFEVLSKDVAAQPPRSDAE